DADVNRVEMNQVLSSAGLFSLDRAGTGTFAYKYVYYYFVAKYLDTKLSTQAEGPTVRSTLARFAANLHVDDYANILIFFVYLTMDEETIRLLLGQARKVFQTYKPCNLETDVIFEDGKLVE